MRTVAAITLALLAVVGIAVGLMAAVWSPPEVYGVGMLRFVPCVGSVNDPTCGGLLPASPEITDRVVLGSTEVTAGETFEATLVVTNHSEAGISIEPYCTPRFLLALTNSENPPNASGFADACTRVGQPLRIAPGTTRFSFPVLTTYSFCAENRASARGSDDPVCLPGPAFPRLPLGTYVVVLIGDGTVALPPAASGPVVVLSSG